MIVLVRTKIPNVIIFLDVLFVRRGYFDKKYHRYGNMEDKIIYHNKGDRMIIRTTKRPLIICLVVDGIEYVYEFTGEKVYH